MRSFLADDRDTLSAGTPIEVGTPGAGIIQPADDVDVFRFDTEGGPVLVSVEPSSISPDLDASLEVYDTSGNLLADVDPPSVMSSEDHAEGLDAWVRLDLAAGTYVVRVDGVGSGDPASDGYSDYASLGRYEVVVFERSRSANRPPRCPRRRPHVRDRTLRGHLRRCRHGRSRRRRGRHLLGFRGRIGRRPAGADPRVRDAGSLRRDPHGHRPGRRLHVVAWAHRAAGDPRVESLVLRRRRR
ncbi:MAG: pre-peptidase C-terminal domain-containing protein [Ilumatobacteraceae bacterium]